MKRFLSIIIALILVLSLFAVNIVAFADDNTATEPGQSEGNGEGQGEGEGEGGEQEEVKHVDVTFNDTLFKEKVFDKYSFEIEMSKNFMLDLDWIYNAELVRSIFEGINYYAWPKQDENLDEKASHKLTYDIGEHAAENAEAPEEKEYKETEHVKLANAPKAASDYKFVGWKIEYEGQPEWRQYDGDKEQGKVKLYNAGAEIAMPEADVKVTAVWAEKDAEVDAITPDDVLYVLYCSPTSDPRDDMKDWSACAVTSTFSVTTEGWWLFRFAVVDGAKVNAEKNYTYDYADVLATTYDNVLLKLENGETVERSEILNIACWCVDTTRPEIDLSETMKTRQNDGLTVGTTYSISTSLSTEDCSSLTTTYIVYKMVDGKWTQIYDSKTREVAEGYEDNISTSGVITPLESDVTGKDVYKIVYTVVDSWGNVGVHKVGEGDNEVEYDYVELLLKVNKAATAPAKDAIEAWKIVLYVIAGLSAIGIVVLIFIKPKQKEAVDARYNANANDENADGANAEQPNEDENK